MARKPYNQIRSELLRLRKSQSEAIKDAAEIWIANIDVIHKEGESQDNKRAFMDAYRSFYQAAEGAPLGSNSCRRPSSPRRSAWGRVINRHL